MIKKSLNSELRIEGIVLTMFDARNNLSHQVVAEIQSHFSEKVFRAIIPRNVRLSEAPSHGQTIFQYDNKSIGAKRYLELAHELDARVYGRAEVTSAVPPAQPLPAPEPDPVAEPATEPEPVAAAESEEVAPAPVGAAADADELVTMTEDAIELSEPFEAAAVAGSPPAPAEAPPHEDQDVELEIEAAPADEGEAHV